MKPAGASAAPWWACAALTLLLCGVLGGWGPPGERPVFWPGLGPVPAGFIAVFAALWAASIALLILHPAEESFRRSAVRILLLAAGARLLLFFHPPSDDVFRYLWEGRVLAEGISPYAAAPLDPSLAGLAAGDPFWGRINHPDMTAAYPPAVLALFALAGQVAYHPASIKVLSAAADLGTAVMLLLLLARRGLGARWVVLYAFNPVVLTAFAGEGHFDALQNLAVTAALVLYDRRRWRGMFALLGLAVQIKYVAVAALPFFIRSENLRHFWIGGLAALLPLAPFAWMQAGGVFASLAAFGTQFAFNGPVHTLLRAVFFDAIAPATAICGVLFATALAVGIVLLHPARSDRFRDDPVSGVFFAFGLLLLLSPTVHFWYLSWALVFLPLRPTFSWLALSLTAGAYFVTYGVLQETGQWRLPAWAFGVEWIPFLLLLAGDGFRFAARLHVPGPGRPPDTVSVVIPTCNEAGVIAGTVAAALTDRAVAEVIVVDGGSTDRTRERAAAAGARVIRHFLPPESGGGRGGQIRHGVLRAAGPVVAVVHADIHVRAPSFSRLIEVLQRQPAVVGGTLGGRFAGRGFTLRLVGWANDLRAALFGVGFGDQVQFFRTAPVAARDLFPDIPLMEDVELSLRLLKLGRVVHLFGDARISDRRWRSRSARRTMMVLRLFFTYLARRPFSRPDTGAMYRRYYGRGRGRLPGEPRF